MASTLSFDVFLSFRGKDTRHGFISHLRKNLRRKRIEFFIDDEMKRGKEITPYIESVIEASKISIIVLSKNYAESTFCLDELAKSMECRESKNQIVWPIFYKVEPSEEMYDEAFAIHERTIKQQMLVEALKLFFWRALNWVTFSLMFERSEEAAINKEMKVERWKSAFMKALELAGEPITENCGEADIIEKITDEILTNLLESNGSQSKEEELMCTSIVGHTANNIFKEIWECLMSDEISRVGIHGMGGVGKTTIATCVYDELRRVDAFTHVCWVTVSKDLSIWKLQKEIANTIKLDLSEEDDELKRAAKLRQRLKTETFVLILDDVWKAFEIEEVGIPPLVGAQKLLLISRNLRVCKGMKCRQIKVKPLPKEEALDLFMRESKNEINDSQEWMEIMDSIVNECAGLPLAIVVLARTMRGVVDIREWRNTLRELQKPCEGENQEMEKKVFRPLKFSYDHLSNDKVQQCFLYCSLFPEGYRWERNDLITYLIGEGIINVLDYRQEELDKGHCMIDELIDASLLEHDFSFSSFDVIKMHDVIRDMGQIVISENSKAQEDGLKVQGETERGVNLKSVLIMEKSMFEKGVPNLPPNCSKLTTLSLKHAYSSARELPSCFYANMQNLAVLEMSYENYLKLLPDSISDLGNLKVLLLRGCESLEYIPSLARLKNLWHLDLSRTNLREIPIGMERLINLKVLKLSWHILHAYWDPIFLGAVLEKLSHLQMLEIDGVEVEADVLISLKKLETLRIEFCNLESLNLYFKSGHWKRLEEYLIVHRLGKRKHWSILKEKYKKVLYIRELSDFGGEKGETDMVLPNNIQKLELGEWNGPMVDVMMNSTFDNLRKLEIKRSEGMQHLFTPALVKRVLHNVEILNILGWYWEMSEVEEIITEEELVGEINNYTTIHLPNLKSLELHSLIKLRSIYKGRMVCPSLEVIKIFDCGKLERLPFCMKERNKHTPIKLRVWEMPNEWWDSLQWDDPNDKSIYQFEGSFFKKPKDDDPSTFDLLEDDAPSTSHNNDPTEDDDPSTSDDDDPMEEVDLTLKL